MTLIGIVSLVLFGASVAGAIACVAVGKRSIARVTRWLGVAALACGMLGALAGVALSWSAMSAPGMTEVGRRRIFSNCLAETVYGTLLTLLVSSPVLLASHRVLRKTTRNVQGGARL